MTKTVGQKSEVAVLSEFVKQDATVLLPFGDNEPYDLVVDRGNGFERIQVKTARYVDGSVKAHLRRTNMTSNGAQQKTYSADEIDMFGFYCPELDAVYAVPFELCGKTEVSLRVDEANAKYANKKTKWAKDYEL